LTHRDIKPANIVLIEGRPVLADIGLTTAFDATASFMGTQGFMPPDVEPGADADLYALGKVLYACLTGFDAGQPPR